MKSQHTNQKHAAVGFVLLELTIVIAILAVIAADAIPNLLRERQAANEDLAISALVQLIIAQDVHMEESGDSSYADELVDLGTEGLIESTLGSGEKSGYYFDIESDDRFTEWTSTAIPVDKCITGTKMFFVDHTKVSRAEDVDSEDVICPRRSTSYTRVYSNLRKRLADLVEYDPLDRSGSGPRPRQVLNLADELAANRDFQNMALEALDGNRNGNLSFDEILSADLLAIARTMIRSPALPSIPWREFDPDAEENDDRKLIRTANISSIQLRRSLRLQKQSVNPAVLTSVQLPLPVRLP